MEHMQQRLVEEIPALRRYARVLTQQNDAADDLVQDCLERAWSRLHRWKPGTNLRAWLFTIMHNLFLNQRRRDSRRPLVYIEQYGETTESVNPEPELHVQLDELDSAMKELTVAQREVLTLVAVEGLSYKETAHILAVPIGTVMSRLSRAREELRIALFDEPPPVLRRVK